MSLPVVRQCAFLKPFVRRNFPLCPIFFVERDFVRKHLVLLNSCYCSVARADIWGSISSRLGWCCVDRVQDLWWGRREGNTCIAYAIWVKEYGYWWGIANEGDLRVHFEDDRSEGQERWYSVYTKIIDCDGGSTKSVWKFYTALSFVHHVYCALAVNIFVRLQQLQQLISCHNSVSLLGTSIAWKRITLYF